ncbi:MAG: hypothetical protein D3923_17590 [Candidatus Electrothrix sp. AR3]|nr:hypothetical protein [Candidatus Electrothrix sp. AR3]
MLGGNLVANYEFTVTNRTDVILAVTPVLFQRPGALFEVSGRQHIDGQFHAQPRHFSARVHSSGNPKDHMSFTPDKDGEPPEKFRIDMLISSGSIPGQIELGDPLYIIVTVGSGNPHNGLVYSTHEFPLHDVKIPHGAMVTITG